MIFFRVSQNINIKTTDGTLVPYTRFKMPSNLENDTVYITSENDFNDLKVVFSNVDKNKYSTRLLKENKVRDLDSFPVELGISNKNEYLKSLDFKNTIQKNVLQNKEEIISLFSESEKVDINQQLKVKRKKEISIVIIGGLGKNISEIISSSTALRILFDKLSELYSNVKMDLYIDASNNSFYSRDKQIYLKQKFINKVLPLSITSKKLCSYDYFIDNSSTIEKSAYFDSLNNVDAWLHKFGIDYNSVPASLKYNELNLENITISKNLKEKLSSLKIKGKLLLFHPFSASAKKTIPQNIASSMLKKLLSKMDDYTIVSTLNIDPKIIDDRFVNLSKESKNINDFMYIISNMDSIITADTSTFHISDAFMIPTVVLSTDLEITRKTKYYKHLKIIKINDKSKSLSKFTYENDSLTLYKYKSWQSLKISKIIKLLDSF
jgi:ADP-heptose:LPS heptosyltransferase